MNPPVTHQVFTGRLLILLLIYEDSILQCNLQSDLILATRAPYIDSARTAYRVYRPVAWQLVDHIRYIILAVF
jgi:hypothetical protein